MKKYHYSQGRNRFFIPQRLQFSFLLTVFYLAAIGVGFAQVPVINDFTPQSAPAGSSITINGSNFSATPANNIVFFGAAKGTVTAASTTQLTVTVPNGTIYAPITVTVANKTAYSIRPFNQTFNINNGVIDANSFARSLDLFTPMSSQSHRQADMNNDGSPDILVPSQSTSSLSVFKNISTPETPAFETKLDFTTDSGPMTIATADLDGDGLLDVAISSNNNLLSVFRNTSSGGTISFAPRTNLSTSNYPEHIATGDMDGDGRPDIVLSNRFNNTFSVFRNTSSGAGNLSFASKVDITTASSPQGIVVTDFNNDGLPEVAVNSSGVVSIFKNTSTSGTISFDPRVDFSTSNPNRLKAADLDNDGLNDLLVVNYGGLSIFQNTSSAGSISMASRVDISFGSALFDIAAGDLNGDGKPDLALVDQTTNLLHILRNIHVSGAIATGSFAPRIDIPTSKTPYGVVIGDLDGNQKADISVSSISEGGVTVYSNQLDGPIIVTTSSSNVLLASFDMNASVNPNNAASSAYFEYGPTTAFGSTSTVQPIGAGATPVPITASVSGLNQGQRYYFRAVGVNGSGTSRGPTNTVIPGVPTITSFTPASGPVGTTVTITGTNFNATSTVSFGAVKAIVTNSSPTSLDVTVPAGASYLPISVNRNGVTGTSATPFVVTFSPVATIDNNSLGLKVDFPVGLSPRSITSADFDGDGKPDVAAVGNSAITVYRNGSTPGAISSTTLTSRSDFGLNAQFITSGDIDGDTKPDLVIGDFSSSTVYVHRNTSTLGSVSFSSFITFSVGQGSNQVEIADLDGDGKPELVVANIGFGSGTTVSVLKNIGTVGVINSSTFASPVSFDSGNGPTSIGIADLDGDGKVDLAIGFNSGISVLRNIGTGNSINSSTFAPKVTFNGPTANCVAVGDLDLDGKPDIVGLGSSQIYVFRNTSVAGSFNSSSLAARQDFGSYSGNLQCVRIGDLNGDGKPEVVAAPSDNVNVFRNTSSVGSISFATQTLFTTSFGGPNSVVIVDIDLDGQNDLITSTINTHNISIFRNQLGYPTITTKSADPITTSGATLNAEVNLLGSPTTAYFEYGPGPNYGFATPTIDLGSAPGTVSVSDNITGSPGATFYYRLVVNTGGRVNRGIESTVYIGVPKITSFSPASGPLNSTVTITGQNFDASPSLNIVLFGTVRANVLTASTTQLTVSVPIGAPHAPISVTTAGLTGYSKNPFIMSFNGGQINSGSFESPVTFTTGTSPRSVAFGDLNNDGKLEMVVTNQNSATFSVYKNTSLNGSFTFDPKVDFSTGSQPYAVAIGDLDRDGKPDIAIGNYGSFNVMVYRNTGNAGTISFASGVAYVTNFQTSAVAIGDIDGDGKPDLAVSSETGSLNIFKNTGGAGGFNASSFIRRDYSFANGEFDYAYGVAINDMDGDGKSDIIVPRYFTGKATVLKYSGTNGYMASNSFSSLFHASPASNPRSVSIGDIDGDGKLDLVVANSSGGSGATFFRNASSGGTISFNSILSLTTGSQPFHSAIADLSGDGKPDIAILNQASGSISVFLNTSITGTVSFANKVDFSAGSNLFGMAIADIDLDGKPDMAATSQSGNVVSLLRNVAMSQSQTITFDSIPAKVFNEGSFNLTAVATSGLGVTFTTDHPGVANISGNSVTIVGAGSVIITAHQAGNSQYSPAPDVTRALVVEKASQSIVFDEIPGKSVVDPPFQLVASASSELPVTFQSSNSSVATVAGSTVTIHGAGSSTITARQAGNANYLPADSVTQLLTVINNLVTPAVPASSITFANTYSTQMQVNFVAGDGTKRLVVMKAGSAVDFSPFDNSIYSVGQIITGNKIVSDDNSTSVNLTGLTPLTTYHFAVFEYNSQAASSRYLVSGAPIGSKATLALPNVYVTSPVNNAINQNTSLTVAAKSLTGATTYTIEVNDAEDFTGNSFVKSGSRTQSFTGLSYGTHYYTRVQTDLSPDFGQTTSFTTLTPNIHVTSPANGAVNQPLTLSITSNALTGAVAYTIEINDAADFSGNSIIQTGAKTQSFSGLSYSKTYYTRVKTDLFAEYGQFTSFSTIVPNIKVTTPADGAVNQPITVSVTANSLAGATTYIIELNDEEDFTGNSFLKTGSRTQSFTGLSYNTEYFTRVKTNTFPVYGIVTSFRTTGADQLAYVTTPANGAGNQNQTVSVTANNVPGATAYTIELNTESDFSGTPLIQSGPGRTYSFSGLALGATYYSRVMTDLSVDWGPTRSFSTKSVLSISYVTNPANNSTNKLWHLNVTANPIAGATLYTIELNTSPTFSDEGIELSASTNTINFSGLAFNTAYYSRVKTNLDPGWGATRQFTTGHPSNYSYMTAPMDGASNVSFNTNITANTVTDAVNYTIEANTSPDFDGDGSVKFGGRTQAFSLMPGQPYYVRVSTDLAPGAWGATRSFTTGDAISLAYITSPINGGTGVPTTVNVTSNSVPGATSYIIELNTTPAFDGLSVAIGGTSRTKNFSGLGFSTTYYARVQTSVNPGVWGPTRSFETVDPGARTIGNWKGEEMDELVDEPFEVIVFGNPFREKLRFSVQSFEQKEATISLFDMTGRIIHESRGLTNTIVEIEKSMAQGSYLLRVSAGGDNKVVHLVKMD